MRVEVELGPVPMDAAGAARALTDALAKTPDVACEGLSINVFDPADGAAFAAFTEALASAGVTLPLALRAETRAALPFLGAVDRLVVQVGALIEDASFEKLARAAALAGVPIEWELRGPTADVPELVDRALAASAAAGLEEILVSVDAPQPVHAVSRRPSGQAASR